MLISNRQLKRSLLFISFFGAAISMVPLILLTRNKGVMGKSVNLLVLSPLPRVSVSDSIVFVNREFENGWWVFMDFLQGGFWVENGRC
jgi:Mn2+/Fe2+ NRAMP family transporter